MKKYLKLFRVNHYIKNLLIFTTLIFGAELFTNDFYLILVGFVAFSLMSSTIYIVNDVLDYEVDKKTYSKKEEPIAKGEISRKKALKIALITFIIAVILNYFTKNLTSYFYLLLYFLLNIFYSLVGKKIAYLELFMMISFYIIRVYYGASILNVPVSNLLNLTVIFGALYLISMKRNVEMKNKKYRKVFEIYNEKNLRVISIISLVLMIAFYTMWTIQEHIDFIFLTPIIVIFIFYIYDKDTKISKTGNPIEILLKDKFLILICILYGILMVTLMEIYL